MRATYNCHILDNMNRSCLWDTVYFFLSPFMNRNLSTLYYFDHIDTEILQSVIPR